MKISIVVAMDNRGGIGIQNHLPWKLSADLKRFKTLTMGHHVLMGRNTYLSLKGTLPGRRILVVSEPEFHPKEVTSNVVWVNSIQDGISHATHWHEIELFIGGGSQIYAQCLPITQRIYLTRVDTICQVDAFFPDYELQDWTISESTTHPADEKNEFPYTFQILDRIVK